MNDEAVLAELADLYPGALDLRGLWVWAKGDVTALEFPEEPLKRWTQAWEKAASGRPPTRSGIVRQALLDHPGHEALLSYLKDLATASFSKWEGTGEVLVVMFESLARPLSAERVWTLLQAFPPVEMMTTNPSDAAFALSAPAMQGKFSPSLRYEIESALFRVRSDPKPADQDVLRSQIMSTLAIVPLCVPDIDTGDLRQVEVSLRSRLTRVFEETGDVRDEEMKRVVEPLEDLRGFVDAAPAGNRQITEALFRLLACLRTRIERDPVLPVTSVAEGLVHALWATDPENGRTEPPEDDDVLLET